MANAGWDIQLFYLHAASAFLRHYPVNGADLLAKAQIGDRYVNLVNVSEMAREEREVLQVVGYFILAKVGKIVDQRQRKLEEIERDTEKKAIFSLLRRNKVHVALKPPSRVSKCVNDPRRCVRRVSDLVSKQYDKVFGSSRSSTVTGTKLSPSYLSAANIYAMKKDGVEFGHALVATRATSRVGYLATRTRESSDLVAAAIARAKSANQRLMFVAAGGFSTSAGAPEGLTFQDGRVINAALGPRHGLVIFDEHGGVRVADLNDEFTLPGISKPLAPSANLIDYYYLSEWLKTNRASAFQTYLLAHGDKFLLDDDKVPSTSTERRFFGAVRDANTGDLSIVLVNIPIANDLFTAAHDTFRFLGSIDGRAKKIEFLVYLDVGAYDILRVFDKNGQGLSQPSGKKDPRTATNLIYVLGR